MRKYVIIFLLAASSSAEASVAGKRENRESKLPAPNVVDLTTFDPPGITITWIPVKSTHEPVQGYKVRLVEIKGKKTFRFKTVNGTKTLVEETDPAELDFSAPKGEIMEYKMAGAEQSQLTVHGIKLDVPYQINVLAYSENGDGPPSSNMGIQLHSENKMNKTMYSAQE